MKTGFYILGLICSLIAIMVDVVNYNLVLLVINCLVLVLCCFAIGSALEKP